MLIKIYRVFAFNTHVIWSKELPDSWEHLFDNPYFDCLDVATRTTEIPYVYTKNVASDVAADLSSIRPPKGGRADVFETIAKIVEAYPASYHHAPNQEIGIGVGLDHNVFDMWPSWRYYKVSGHDQTIRFIEMKDDAVAERRWLKEKRPYGFPADVWKKFPRP